MANEFVEWPFWQCVSSNDLYMFCTELISLSRDIWMQMRVMIFPLAKWWHCTQLDQSVIEKDVCVFFFNVLRHWLLKMAFVDIAVENSNRQEFFQFKIQFVESEERYLRNDKNTLSHGLSALAWDSIISEWDESLMPSKQINYISMHCIALFLLYGLTTQANRFCPFKWSILYIQCFQQAPQNKYSKSHWKLKGNEWLANGTNQFECRKGRYLIKEIKTRCRAEFIE